MAAVVLFFPDIGSLTEYATRLESGPVEINSLHLTLRDSLSRVQIDEARLSFNAVCWPSKNWEELEKWFSDCQRKPYEKITWHMKCYASRINDGF